MHRIKLFSEGFPVHGIKIFSEGVPVYRIKLFADRYRTGSNFEGPYF
jgi:hypothetical protein